MSIISVDWITFQNSNFDYTIRFGAQEAGNEYPGSGIQCCQSPFPTDSDDCADYDHRTVALDACIGCGSCR